MTHPLDGAWERIQDSQKDFAELRAEIEIFKKDARYGFEVAELESDGYRALRVTASLEPSNRWGVLVGNIAHNLRASLDNLVWELIRKNGKTPEDFKRPLPEYPVYLYEDDYKRRGRPKIAGRVSERHEEVIERTQPFHWGGEASTLWALHELNNTDKHRALQLVAAQSGTTQSPVNIRGYMFGALPPAGLSFAEINEHTRFEQGAYLFPGNRVGALHESIIEIWPDIKYVPIATEVCFRDGCDLLKGRPVLKSLDDMGHHVANIVLGRFRDVFHPYPEAWGLGDLPPPDVSSSAV